MRTIIIDQDRFLDLIQYQTKEVRDEICHAIEKSEINWKDPKDFVWTEDTAIIVNVERSRASSLVVYHCNYDDHDYYANKKLLSCSDHDMSLEEFKDWGQKWIEKVI